MHREAQRILDAIDGRITKTTKSGAGIEVTYGQVYDITDGLASVYIIGSRELAESSGGVAEPSPDFRIPTHLTVAVSDHVRVSMDDRGDRWVDEVFTPQSSLSQADEINVGDLATVGLMYDDEVLADSPSGYWRLGESSGTTLQDATANNRDGTLVGTPTLGVTGAVYGDTAIDFNDNGHVTVADNAAWDFTTGPFTLECWVKRDGTINFFGDGIIGKGSGALMLWLTSSGIVTLSKRDEADLVKSTAALPDDGAWHHIVAQYQNGSVAKMWVDKVDVSTGADTTRTLTANTDDMAFASKNATATDRLHGHLDEVAIYPSILSSTRIAAHYDARNNTGIGAWTERVRVVGSTGKIEWSADAVERDVNLYRSGSSILKTDDALQAASLAIGTNKVSRFVPLVPYSEPISGATYTSADASIQTIELTALPSSGVVAAQVQIVVKSSTADSGNAVTVIHYSGTGVSGGMTIWSGSVANYTNTAIATIETGGTNNRQIKYWRSYGAAGTVTWYLRVTGYWTTQ